MPRARDATARRLTNPYGRQADGTPNGRNGTLRFGKGRLRMALLRRLSEGLARKTSRRGFFGRGADIAFGALIGAAAGVATRPGSAGAGRNTVCAFPGPPCDCDHCLENATCAKPCVINTTWYAAGCWVTGGVTCCDCTCATPGSRGWCGCGTDYHNDPANCPGAGPLPTPSPTPTPTP